MNHVQQASRSRCRHRLARILSRRHTAVCVRPGGTGPNVMTSLVAQWRVLLLVACTLQWLFALIACSSLDGPATPQFEYSRVTAEKPWNHENFDAAAGKFTFAIFSDLTGGERVGVFDIAMAQMRLLRPEFIISVGDLIEGESSDPVELARQWDVFDQRAGQALAPVFYLGGNHDLAGVSLRQVWAERYGPRYYHFVYRNTLFLVLDSEDHTSARLNEIVQLREQALARVRTEGWDALKDSPYTALPEYAAGNISADQSAYFRRVIAEHPDVRWTFLLVHKAPWLRSDYDHFRSIEDALAARPYTVFHGHEHAYKHRQRNGRDYIQLATTGGVPLPDNGQVMDHVTLVSVGADEVEIVNLLLSGILDRTGQVPGDPEGICFEQTICTVADP